MTHRMVRMSTQFRYWLYPVLIVALVFAAWSGSWDAALGKSDFAGHVGLMSTLASQMAEEVTLHLWTPDWNSGASLVFWYIQPLFSSFLLLPFVDQWGLVDGIRIGDTFFLALAGLAMYAWCRQVSGSRTSAFVGALVYALHPSVFTFVGEVGHAHQPVSMTIIPLLFLAWTRLGETPGWTNAIFAAVASALLFYDMERFWLILPYALVFYFAVVVRHEAPDGRATQIGRALGIGLAVGIGMSLLVAFPTLPAVFERPLLQWHDSQSIEVFRQYYSFPHLLALVDRDGMLAVQLQGNIPQEFVSMPGQWYQGGVAMLLVGIGAVLLVRSRQHERERNQLALVLALFSLALLIAFGVHAIAPKHWSLFGGLASRDLGFGLGLELTLLALFVALFFGVVLYLAYSTLAPNDAAGRRATALLLGIAVLGFLFAKPFELLADTIFIYAHLRAPSHFAFPALPFLLATATSLAMPIWIRTVGEHRRALFTAAVVVLLLLDVSPYRFQDEWTVPDEQVEQWEAAFAKLEDEAPGRILDTHHYNPITDMLAVDTAGRDMAWSWLSWTSTRYVGDIIKIGFFDSIRIARARKNLREFNTTVAAELSALANVRFVSRLVGVSPEMPESKDFEEVERGDDVEMYRNRKALAYLQFYPEAALLTGSTAETVPFVGALAQEGVASVTLSEGSPDPTLTFDYWHGEDAAALAGADAKELPGQAPFRGESQSIATPEQAAPCELTNRRTASIELHCNFERAGTLVVSEAWFPNWQVEIGGITRPALRINHAFLGAAVEPGAARIEFVHVPSTATRIGKTVSSFSWLAALGAWIYFARKNARAARSPA